MESERERMRGKREGSGEEGDSGRLRKRYREKGMKLEEMNRVGDIKEHIYREVQAMREGARV